MNTIHMKAVLALLAVVSICGCATWRTEAKQQNATHLIKIHADQTVEVDGQTTRLEGVGARLEELRAGKREGIAILLHAQAPHSAIVSVLDQMAAGGYLGISVHGWE